jgi:hypothetical protein
LTVAEGVWLAVGRLVAVLVRVEVGKVVAVAGGGLVAVGVGRLVAVCVAVAAAVGEEVALASTTSRLASLTVFGSTSSSAGGPHPLTTSRPIRKTNSARWGVNRVCIVQVEVL